MSHRFALKLPNGFEVDIAGDGDFVTGAFADVKTGAAIAFNRFAAIHSPEERPAPVAPALPAPAPPTPEAIAAEASLPSPKGEDREEYYDLLLRFREFCAGKGEPFQLGVRNALQYAMGEIRKNNAPAGNAGKMPRQSRNGKRSNGVPRILICEQRPGEQFTLDQAAALCGRKRSGVYAAVAPSSRSAGRIGGFTFKFVPDPTIPPSFETKPRARTGETMPHVVGAASRIPASDDPHVEID